MNKKELFIMGTIVIIFLAVLLWRQDTTAVEENVPKNTGNYEKKLNLIILLDLSDRIDPRLHPYQVERDLKVIKAIFNWFERRVKQKLYIHSRDRFQIIIAPQPNKYQSLLFKNADKLILNCGKISYGGKPTFDKAKKEMFITLNTIYQRASKAKQFVGADIWIFFRDELPGLISANSRNILIILTDGYIDFNANFQHKRPRQGNLTTFMEVAKYRNSKNWRKKFEKNQIGLIPVTEKFPNLEILILEVNLRNMMDRPILEKYWFDWFRKMGVQKFALKLADYSVENTRDAVWDFLKNNKDE